MATTTKGVPSGAIRELVRIAQRAGRAILDIYEAGPSARLKADRTPVTEADVAAEQIILAGLSRLEPDCCVIAEEAMSREAATRCAPRFYLVDPLDGTREFIARNGEFTVNIGLVESGAPVAGVVYAPAVSRLYWGVRGLGAGAALVAPETDVDAVPWRTIAAQPVPARGLRVVASRSHRDPDTDAWLAGQHVSEIVAAGSSLKFCLLAEGAADVYPRFGRTMEWDTAAGHAVLAAAGGEVVGLDGGPFLYGKAGAGFANPGFIAWGRREIR